MIRFVAWFSVSAFVACGPANLQVNAAHINPQSQVSGDPRLKIKRGESLNVELTIDVTESQAKGSSRVVEGIKVTPSCEAITGLDPPTGVTCTFSPATLVSPARETTVTITTAANATGGSYAFSVATDVKVTTSSGSGFTLELE